MAGPVEPISMKKPPGGEGRTAAIIVAVALIAIVVIGLVLIAIE
jgi:hypothetical protein